jgi:DNA-directed RNA polymerase specialized sigma24 family protein
MTLAQESDAGIEQLELLELDRALDSLAREDKSLAQLIEMRYSGGMTAEETAEALGQSVHIVRHDLRLAQAWLRRELSR